MSDGSPHRKGLGTKFVIGIILAGLGFLLFRDPIKNDWNTFQLGRNLRTLSHPVGTSRMASREAFGLLWGNGNHCDVFAGEVRSFNGDRKAIKAAYEEVTVANPFGGRAHISVEFFEKGQLPEYSAPNDLLFILAWNAGLPPNGHYYLVSVGDSFDADDCFDFRCH